MKVGKGALPPLRNADVTLRNEGKRSPASRVWLSRQLNDPYVRAARQQGWRSRAAFKLYGKTAAVTEFREFPDRGHSLTVDSGWTEVAQASLDWLTKQGIPGQRPARSSIL